MAKLISKKLIKSSFYKEKTLVGLTPDLFVTKNIKVANNHSIRS
jgi:hypothetical protein